MALLERSRPDGEVLSLDADLDAIERARSILAATDGASALEGEMVDAATKRLAESVLARASEL